MKAVGIGSFACDAKKLAPGRFLASSKFLGGGMVGTHAGDMIGVIAHGSCTDVPPTRK